MRAIDDELDAVAGGRAAFKAVRGEYGSGKTFFARWLAERAKRPRHGHRRGADLRDRDAAAQAGDRLPPPRSSSCRTAAYPPSALREVVDAWFYTLEEDVLAEAVSSPSAARPASTRRWSELLETRLAGGPVHTPAFAAALRAYRKATLRRGPGHRADAARAGSAASPTSPLPPSAAPESRATSTTSPRSASCRACSTILRDSGHPGLLLVLDEIETLQRVRSDVRDKGLNALRQLARRVDSGRFPGLYLLITGTPAFYDGPQGVTRLTPLAQRLATDFGTDPRFDSPRAVQLRLPGFDLPSSAGARQHDPRPVRGGRRGTRTGSRALVDDAYIADLADAVAGELGGQVGVAPRVFLRKLVADVLDRVAEFADFDPRQHYKLDPHGGRATATERNAAGLTVPAAPARRRGTRPVT